MVRKKFDVAQRVKRVERTALAVVVREVLRNGKFSTALSTFIQELSLISKFSICIGDNNESFISSTTKATLADLSKHCDSEHILMRKSMRKKNPKFEKLCWTGPEDTLTKKRRIKVQLKLSFPKRLVTNLPFFSRVTVACNVL